MSSNVTRKLIGSHLLSGEMTPGEEIAIHIDQTLALRTAHCSTEPPTVRRHRSVVMFGIRP